MTGGLITECGSCGCPDLKQILDLGEQPLPQATRDRNPVRYPLRLVECQRCSLVQLDYIAPQQKLFPRDYPYTTGNTQALKDHFAGQARFIDMLLGHTGKDSGPLVVDIGGNDGTMLQALRFEAPDARLMLIEPTDQALKCEVKDPAAAQRIEVVQEYFTAELAVWLRVRHGPASVIAASNVFGHVPDPHDFLRGVTELLDENGVLLIENQDWYNIDQDLHIDTIYHEHLRYYSPLSLAWLLEAHGLMIVSLTRIAMHGGAFRVVARRQKGHLDIRAGNVVHKLNVLLDEAAQAGPVYAVGAPTRATSLVNRAGLGKYLDCACEIRGSEKIGALIPGTDVPVVDEQALFDAQPPHVLLLAWDLAETIVPALRRKGYAGKIIVPLPDPRILDA